MKHIIRFRWLIAVMWIGAAVSLFVFAPNLQDLVREKGQIAAPEDSPSVQAQQLLESMQENQKGNQTSAVLVFHEADSFDSAEREKVAQSI